MLILPAIQEHTENTYTTMSNICFKIWTPLFPEHLISPIHYIYITEFVSFMTIFTD